MKKAFSLIFSLVMMIPCFNVYSLGAYNQSLIIDEYFEDYYIVDVKGENNNISETLPRYYFSQESGYAFDYNCYSKLDTAQRIIYDAIVDNPGVLSVNVNFENGVFDYNKNWNSQYFSEIMKAICTDRPDIFYYAGYGISNGKLHNASYVSSLTYTAKPYDSTIYTQDNVMGYYNALMAKLPTIPVDTSNRYNFMKSVNDYLCNNIYYPDLNSSDYVMSAHDAYGALVEGRAVCQGYSDAFKLICDYYKIPCVCISGTSGGAGHMWNAMQMDDGLWYLTDTTWNDQSPTIFYDFFLVGTQSTNTYFGGNRFDADHVNDSDLFLPSLNYSATAYNRTQNHNTEFSATYNSYADSINNRLYLSVFDIGKSNVYYNGIYVDVADFSTGETFTAPSGSLSADEIWEMVILADLNSDGVCDENDYSAAVNLVVSSDNVIDTPQEKSCDINVDGVLDVLDAAVIAKASSGLNTNIQLS